MTTVAPRTTLLEIKITIGAIVSIFVVISLCSVGYN